MNGRPTMGFPFGNGKRKGSLSYFHRRPRKGAGVEPFHHISFVTLHESLKVQTKAPEDKDVDKLDR